MSAIEQDFEFYADIASAPGDLPLREITARNILKGHQFRHDNQIEPLRPLPGQLINVFATSGRTIVLDKVLLRYTTDGSLPNHASASVPMQAVDADWESLSGYVKRWCGQLPGFPDQTTVRYQIVGWQGDSDNAEPDYFAHDGQGFWFRFADQSGIRTFAFKVDAAPRNNPDWMQDAVIYEIFLDRFHPGNADGRFPDGLDLQEMHGGNLLGVEKALPYLHKLGVNCLWLSPIGVSETYHRYDASDYFKVDPSLGTNEDLLRLTTKARKLGMRTILDFVPSHMSWHHPAFKAAQHDQNAETASWFIFNEWPNDYRCFLQAVPSLVSINTNDAGARQFLIDSAIFWMQECGIDGFRIDHAIGHGMDFWLQFRNALEGVNPDVVTIGEVTDTPDALRSYGGRMHDVLDFPLARALRLAFGNGQWPLSKLSHFLESFDLYMKTGPGRVSFLDNHDMNRFLFVAGNETARLKMAAVCQFTLCHTPVLYYGTEVGMTQELDLDEAGFGGDAEVRRDMPWSAEAWDQPLLAFFQRLIDLRHTNKAMSRGQRQKLMLDDGRELFAYARDAGEDGAILVAFNRSSIDQPITLPAKYKDGHIALCSQGVAELDKNSGPAVVLTMPAMSAVIVNIAV